MKRVHRRPPALVAGGGIAGPVLAMFLRRIGVEPVVFEGRPPTEEAGAFLNLAPNGLAVLEELGLADAVRGAGTPTTAIRFHNHRGKPLGELPAATLLIRRSALNRVLLRAAAARGVRLEHGRRIAGAGQDAGSASLRLEDGSAVRGCFLAGCDGLHSRVRRALFPEAPAPAYTGVVDTGGFTANSLGLPADGIMRMTFGLRGFFGYQAVPWGEIFWFANVGCSPGEVGATLALGDGEWRRRLLEVYRGDHAPIAEIIRSAAHPLPRWAIHDLPWLPSWHRGRACLIGDAAHATSPHAGQGASLAMEDALVLARSLRDVPEVERAFAAFERARRGRVERLVREARRHGRLKAPSSAPARLVRDLVLPLFLRLGARKARESYGDRLAWGERAA